ncbi:MAG TPA: hypothetical protein VK681_14870 [Reyranella sp.]|nr:hypothetical protein [Reyranella sp.]
MQLDVFPNPLGRARRAFPYVVVLQADIATLGRERREFVLLMPSMTNVPVTELRGLAGNLDAFRDRIVDAIDWTFLGA